MQTSLRAERPMVVLRRASGIRSSPLAPLCSISCAIFSVLLITAYTPICVNHDGAGNKIVKCPALPTEARGEKPDTRGRKCGQVSEGLPQRNRTQGRSRAIYINYTKSRDDFAKRLAAEHRKQDEVRDRDKYCDKPARVIQPVVQKFCTIVSRKAAEQEPDHRDADH